MHTVAPNTYVPSQSAAVRASRFYSLHVSEPPTIAMVAPRHHPSSVPSICLPISTCLSGPNSYPSLSKACMKVMSRHHSGRSSSSAISALSLPQYFVHEDLPSQSCSAKVARVDTETGGALILSGRRGRRRS